MMKKILILIFSPVLFRAFIGPVLSADQARSSAKTGADIKEEVLEGRVVDIVNVEEKAGAYQDLQILVKKGSLKGEKITVEVGGVAEKVGEPRYKEGDSVTVVRTRRASGEAAFYIRDFLRRKPLLWLFVIFIIVTVVVARFRGFTSLLGMAFSFLIIFKFILPRILAGWDPLFTVVLSSLILIPITFYLSHGFNKKATTAIFSTFFVLVLIGFLARIFTSSAHLTGFSSEEAAFLQVLGKTDINFRGLVLAGIMVGVLGILDDVTVAQTALVKELREENPRAPKKVIFNRALSVGKDHIASMVNTLILVYAGASMPLLLLFVSSSESFSQIINNEALAEEIVRTLVGSIGLIFAVPLTTYIAVHVYKRGASS